MPLPNKPDKPRSVYLDHAATTPMSETVLQAMLPYLVDQFHNPSALYKGGLAARQAIDGARRICAELIGAQPDTIAFTSGGTESCNLAIFGVADAYEEAHGKPGHVVTSNIEHHAVLEACAALEQRGWRVTYLAVDKEGYISPDQVVTALTPETALVSIMYANNEIGTVEPIADIGRALLSWRKKQGTATPWFHTDACQATPELVLEVEKLHVDLLTCNGSKMYGPKGAGMLYVRRKTPVQSQMVGGGQERGLRSGTENVAAIVGFATAFQEIRSRQDAATIAALRDKLWKGLQNIPAITLNGPALQSARLANNLHMHIEGLDQEAALLYLDEYGIQVGIGSACSTRTETGSHVMKAIGQKPTGNIRLSLGKKTTQDDIAYVLRYVPEIIATVRGLRK